MNTDLSTSKTASPLRWRWVPVLGLLFLSPICAEYLIGYDESIGHPLDLLGGLIILAPLYGAIAVIIREIARRAGRGWPTILLLSAAFGLVQAGLIDQSLFHLEFSPDDPDWATQQPQVLIPGLGIDAEHLTNFVIGHVIWSFAAPIAVIECCAPKRATRPWLGKPGLCVMVALYLLAAAVIYSDFGAASGAGATELIGTIVVVLALVALALLIPRRAMAVPGRVPPVWLLGCMAVVFGTGHQFLPASWTGVAADVLALGLFGALLLYWSGRTGWRRGHVLAVAGGFLLVNAGTSFLVEPLGNPPLGAKYAANTVLTLGVIALLTWAFYRLRRHQVEPVL